MIQLKSGALRCEVEPHLGGCIAGPWLDGVPVLRSLDPRGATGVGPPGGLLPARAFLQSRRADYAASLGLAVLQPGESLSAQMTISVERVQ